MEKRRRARINASLTELKTFLLEMIKKEVSKYNIFSVEYQIVSTFYII
jgi:hypothetical protein